MTKVVKLANDELVSVYVQFRERRRQRKKEDDIDKEKLEKIEGILLERFRADGSESVRTKYGTAYKTLRTSASVADRDVFMGHVLEKKAFELLEVRCSKEAVTQYKSEHGEIPPGVDWREEVHINVKQS